MFGCLKRELSLEEEDSFLNTVNGLYLRLYMAGACTFGRHCAVCVCARARMHVHEHTHTLTGIVCFQPLLSISLGVQLFISVQSHLPLERPHPCPMYLLYCSVRTCMSAWALCAPVFAPPWCGHPCMGLCVLTPLELAPKFLSNRHIAP